MWHYNSHAQQINVTTHYFNDIIPSFLFSEIHSQSHAMSYNSGTKIVAPQCLASSASVVTASVILAREWV